MVNPVQKAFDKLLPPAEELWGKAGAEMVDVEAADGFLVKRPFFDLEVTNTDTFKKPIEIEPLTTRSGRHLGFTALHQVEVNGIDHLARAIVTDGNHDLTITSGAAWMTTIGGYTHDRAIKLAVDTGQPNLQVGSPHSGQNLPFLLEGLRVPQTLHEARATSLARTAQIEQLVFSELSRIYGLPPQQWALGDSRDGIITPGQYLYAPMYKAELLGFDTAARSMIDRMELKDVQKVARWALTTVLGGSAVAVCMAKEGQLGTLKGATSANPNFWASTMSGTLRSLVGGEGRKLIETVPWNAHGIDILYGRDGPSHIDEVKEAWGPNEHPNVYVKTVPGGTHPALLHPLARKGTRTRTRELVNEYRANNGNADAMNWQRIHGIKDPESPAAHAA